MSDKEAKLKAQEAAIIRRVECEKRAFDIVNKLIEGTVAGDYLIQCGLLINREHYNDIVEERAITLLCGYPLCGNLLQNIPKKQYHISTKTNKVYDISERKKFCSNQCLKASKFFSNQIPESPLWARDREILPEIKLLLKVQDKGIIGEEMVGGAPHQFLKEELAQLEELDSKMSSLKISSSSKDTEFLKDSSLSSELLTNNLAAAKSLERPLVQAETVKENSNEDTDKKTLSPESNHLLLDNKVSSIHPSKTAAYPLSCSNNNENSSILVITENKKKDPSSNSTETSKAPDSKLEQLQKILARKKGLLSAMIVDIQPAISAQCLPVTDKIEPRSNQSDSLTANQYSVGQQKNLTAESKLPNQKQQCNSKQDELKIIIQPLQRILPALKDWVTEDTNTYLFSSSNNVLGPSSFSNIKVKKNYAELCHRLTLQEKELENVLICPTERDETQNTSLKSVPNYDALKQETEKFQVKVVEFITGKRPVQNDKNVSDEVDDNPVYLPTVDAYDQQQIRMKIVLYQIDKIVPDLLVPLALPLHLISTMIREVVSTFKLQKDTIVFKPPEWTLITILVMKMLAKKSQAISEAFDRETATRYFSVLLKSIGYTLSDFDVLTDEILSCCVK